MAPHDPVEDKLMIDGRVVTQVRVVGQIQSVSAAETQTAFTLELDDGTATTEVRVYIADAPAEYDYHVETKAGWVVQAWVEVFGYIKLTTQGKDQRRSISAQRINVVADFNLITHHFLQAVHSHIFTLKGGNLAQGVQQVTSGIQRFDPYAAMHAPAEHANTHNNPYNNTMDMSAGDIQSDIKNFCRSGAGGAKGPTLTAIIQKFPQYTQDEIKQAIEHMSNIGDIYTTGPDTYKA